MTNRQLDHSQHRVTNHTFPLCFLTHDIDLPMNIGSFFRIADALGVEKIYLSGTSPVPPNSKIRKTSRSAENHVPYERIEDPTELLRNLRERGYRIISLEITSSSIDLAKLAIATNDKICLILGAENAGICQALLDASDLAVHIPMLGQNSSMNVAAACAIATYDIARRLAHERQTLCRGAGHEGPGRD
jgi:tRNA G18 (ribose-2'-O)-methylase SpoU